MLGALPPQRAATNGLIIRHGYIVGEFGDTTANDPVYSVAKSFLSTVGSLAFDQGLIKDINDPVSINTSTMAATIRRTIRRSPGRITSSRKANGKARCGGRTRTSLAWSSSVTAKREPRLIQNPGTYYEYNDVRIKRLALSLPRVCSANRCP